MEGTVYPTGWDEKRVRRVVAHYESQSDEDAAAEDDAAFEHAGQTTMEVPSELVPVIREMIARYECGRSAKDRRGASGNTAK